MSYDDLRALVRERRELGEEINFRVTVKYTALRELTTAGVEMHLSFWSFEGGSMNRVFSHYAGNSVDGQQLKSSTLLPGEHYLSFDVTIPAGTEDNGIFAIENMDDLDSELTYKFYVGN
jgi:hypothetical protein